MTSPLATLLSAPLSPDAIARIEAQLAAAIECGDGFVGTWCAERRVGFSGVVVNGQLVNWTLFPAESVEGARSVASALLDQAEAIFNRLQGDAGTAARAAINRAKGLQ
jgi:hypothetical protein